MAKEKDSVYKEFLGEPHINKKELKKENEVFLSNENDDAVQRRILYKKVSRMEKMIYFVSCEITILVVMAFLIWMHVA